VKSLVQILALTTLLVLNAAAQTNAPGSAAATPTPRTVQTLVCFRHAEKPKDGLGQLTPRGLNRSLALPNILLAKFGRPDFLFAPCPTQKVDNGRYYYVRPIATIEPTAIRCGLPLNTQFGYREIDQLEAELQKPQYAGATIFIAWEHAKMDEFARQLVKHHGADPKQVPKRSGNDYDTLLVFRTTRDAGGEHFTFAVDHEGLNDSLSDTFPEPARPSP
jgi:hypothetical protein